MRVWAGFDGKFKSVYIRRQAIDGDMTIDYYYQSRVALIFTNEVSIIHYDRFTLKIKTTN